MREPGNKGAKITLIENSKGYREVLTDFKSIRPTSIKEIQGTIDGVQFTGVRGKLPDGTGWVTARSTSSHQGMPTLEFNFNTVSRATKVRYGK